MVFCQAGLLACATLVLPFQQIRPALLRTLHGFIMPPGVYYFRVAAEQFIGYFPAAEISRAGIYRWRQHIVLEGIEQGRGFIIEHAGQETPYSIDHYSSCQFSPLST